MQVTPYEPITVFIPLALEETDWFALEVQNIPYYTIKLSWNRLNVYFNSSEHFLWRMLHVLLLLYPETFSHLIPGTLKVSNPFWEHSAHQAHPYSTLIECTCPSLFCVVRSAWPHLSSTDHYAENHAITVLTEELNLQHLDAQWTPNGNLYLQ